MATMSILGLYEYDNTIFDNLNLPTAADITTDAEKVANPWIPDKSDFIAYLCMNLAELELVYPSASIMKQMIGIWSKAHHPEWVQLYNTMLYKYNPIWNKDGTWKETRDLDGKNDRTAGLTVTDTRTYTNLKDVQTGAVEHDVTGYDSNTYSPDTRDKYNDLTNTRNGEDKNVQTIQGTDKYYTEDNGTITREEGGNIGVTTTQAMINEQREIVQFNLYDYITNSFKTTFCILIY